MKNIKISDNEQNQRIDKFLNKFFKGANQGFIYKMLRKKNFVLNNKKSTGGEILKAGDVITIFLSDETYERMRIGDEKTFTKGINGLDIGLLDIVYEDEQIIIVNKPINMLSQRDNSNTVSVNDILLNYVIGDKNDNSDYRAFTPSICNRLDRNTSGLIIFAKTFVAARYIGDMIKEKRLRKFYLCLVSGKVDDKKKLIGIVNKDKTNNLVSYRNIYECKNIKAESLVSLEYKSLKSNNRFSLLEVELFTGKSHQIRVQLSGNNHPILGDPKYGNVKVNKELGVKTQLLCAYKLVFPKIELSQLSHLSYKSIEIKPPRDFEEFLNRF